MLQRIIRIIAWASLAFIVFVTLSPIGLRPHFAPVTVERFGAFGLAGLLFGTAYPTRLWWVLTIILGSAIGLEILQHLVPHRHGVVSDAIVKCTGGIVGVGCSRIVSRLLAGLNHSPHGDHGLPQDAKY